MNSLIEKLKKENLLGRSGSMFPVYKKWEVVKNTPSQKKFVICNASEGEVNTNKDYFILSNHTKEVIGGVAIAMQELGAIKGYIYLNKDYYDELYNKLSDEIKKSGNDIEIIKKRGGYIGGEETSVIESIEKKRPEPRIKPPFPATVGLWGHPTLVNNVETLYCVYKISNDSYQGEKFYSVEGDAPKRGVYLFSKDETIANILKNSGNVPDFDYFLQVGGGASGKIILPSETNNSLCSLGSIIIYNRLTTDCFKLMKSWVDFFLHNNCDKCTPCREGLFRLLEMIEKRDFSLVDDIFFVMEKTPLCPLGCVAVNPFKTLLEKIINQKDENNN